MFEILLSFIVGGIIPIITLVITLRFSEKRISKEQKVNYLKDKKTMLMDTFEKIKSLLLEGMAENNYDVDMISKFTILFPKNVYEQFNKMIDDKEKRKDAQTLKFHYLDILNEMHKSIAEIDRQIEYEIGIK